MESMMGKKLYTFLNNKWHWDFVFNHYIAKPSMIAGHNITYKILDKGLIEMVGPTGLVSLLKKATLSLSSFQSGLVYNYAFTIFLSTTLILMLVPSNLFGEISIYLLLLLPLFVYASSGGGEKSF